MRFAFFLVPRAPDTWITIATFALSSSANSEQPKFELFYLRVESASFSRRSSSGTRKLWTRVVVCISWGCSASRLKGPRNFATGGGSSRDEGLPAVRAYRKLFGFSCFQQSPWIRGDSCLEISREQLLGAWTFRSKVWSARFQRFARFSTSRREKRPLCYRWFLNAYVSLLPAYFCMCLMRRRIQLDGEWREFRTWLCFRDTFSEVYFEAYGVHFLGLRVFEKLKLWAKFW